jgi:hypothetical protein
LSKRSIPAVPPSAVFISNTQLRQRWGDVSFMFIERRIAKDPRFPKPVRLGSRNRFFRLEEVEQYERTLAGAK